MSVISQDTAYDVIAVMLPCCIVQKVRASGIKEVFRTAERTSVVVLVSV